jgi:hypothetical protein
MTHKEIWDYRRKVIKNKFVETGKLYKDAAKAIGVEATTFSRYLNGSLPMDEERLHPLADFFGIHVSVFINIPVPSSHSTQLPNHSNYQLNSNSQSINPNS